jgi:hypothetical protein
MKVIIIESSLNDGEILQHDLICPQCGTFCLFHEKVNGKHRWISSSCNMCRFKVTRNHFYQFTCERMPIPLSEIQNNFSKKVYMNCQQYCKEYNGKANTEITFFELNIEREDEPPLFK